MYKAIKGTLLFGAMSATPLVLDILLKSKKASAPLNLYPGLWLAGALTAAAIIAFAGIMLTFVYIQFVIGREKLEYAANCLKLAERDLNDCLSSGLEHGGRKGRVKERYEWNRLVKNPVKQVLREGYQTVAHDLVKANEEEMQGKRKGTVTLPNDERNNSPCTSLFTPR